MKLLTEPYLLTLYPSSEMNIVWIISEEESCFVEYGSTSELGSRKEAVCHRIDGFKKLVSYDTPEKTEDVSVYQYIAKIDGLLPGETVYYRCVYGENYTDTYFFHTAPENGEPYRFAQISDLQALSDCHRTVHKIGTFHPDFILYSGDCVYNTRSYDEWFYTDNPDKEFVSKAFFPCMQQRDGARLMQYAPMFVCPGNHEPDDRPAKNGVPISEAAAYWNYSIFMQLFRPLYTDGNYGGDGKRWYSVDYSDMHITSLSINRQQYRDDKGRDVFLLLDDITPDSPQIKWLENDLGGTKAKFKWIIQHFHILNRAWDAQFNLSEPVINEKGGVEYPYDRGAMLIDIFSGHKVNAVTYGHSHVYERYFTKGTHYIEAAYLSITFARENSPAHPSGLLPVFEDNSKRSFVIFDRKDGGIFARGFYADDLTMIDSYVVADEDGSSVSPV